MKKILFTLFAMWAMVFASVAQAQTDPPDASKRVNVTYYQPDGLSQLAATGDTTCDAKKPAEPMAPGKKGGGKKKCITMNVPLDDGYMLAKAKKGSKPSKAKKLPST